MGAVDGSTNPKVVQGRSHAATSVASQDVGCTALYQAVVMKLPDVRPSCARHRYGLLSLPLVLLAALTQLASGQQSDGARAAKPAPLGVEQVVQNLAQMNLRRLHALSTYQSTRTYRVEYRGFAGPRSAEMVVNVKYHSPGTKEFVIQSATGSKLMIDQVLKKLLAAETEAQDAEMQRHSALTDENYRFTLVGSESKPSGMTYVLEVEPRRKDKFLYRGRIWVDAIDFAVVRVEAEPAKNPSFWTKRAEIVQVYKKVSNFWLPESNRSATAIRLGGHADLTIDYGNYVITNSSEVSAL